MSYSEETKRAVQEVLSNMYPALYGHYGPVIEMRRDEDGVFRANLTSVDNAIIIRNAAQPHN